MTQIPQIIHFQIILLLCLGLWHSGELDRPNFKRLLVRNRSLQVAKQETKGGEKCPK